MNTTGPATIASARLHELLISPSPPRIIDVRTASEFETAHIRGAHNVPLDLLRQHRHEIRQSLGHDVVLVCRSGQRAIHAESALREAGLTNANVLEGGMVAWESADLDVARSAERWELERQVRLVAGSIVAASIVGSIAAPKLKWLAAMIGGGLTYAAISNTCTMGMLLARLPYNRAPMCDLDAIVTALAADPVGRQAS